MSEADWPTRLREHVRQRTIVLPEHRVLFFPMPKAGCTSTLWLLAAVVGLSPDDFARSALPEVSPALVVHDLGRWPRRFRLGELGPAEAKPALHDDGWFRFTVVRDPGPRLWSAWQSKLLMREPRFVETYGGFPWFPEPPSKRAPERVLDAFRGFVVGIADQWADEPIRDPHWTPQSEIVGSIALNHVGRLESLDATIAALREHVGDRPEFERPVPRENRTPLRYDPLVYDDASAAVVRDLYRDDFEQFGYPPLVTNDDDGARRSWLADAVSGFDVITEVAARHERLAALSAVVRDRSDEVRTLKDDVRERKAEIRRLQKQAEADAKTISDRESKLAKVTDQRDTAVSERNATRAELKRVYASTSWKATEPLRRVTKFFRRR